MKEVKLSVFDHVLCNFVYNVNKPSNILYFGSHFYSEIITFIV